MAAEKTADLDARIADLQAMRMALARLIETCGRPRNRRECPILAEVSDDPEEAGHGGVAQCGGSGPAADCLCPAVTFHTSRRRAEDHLRGRPELTGVVLDQAQAAEVAWASFGSLLTARPREQPRSMTGDRR